MTKKTQKSGQPEEYTYVPSAFHSKAERWDRHRGQKILGLQVIGGRPELLQPD